MISTIGTVPLKFKQNLEFSTFIEQINERGNITRISFKREVQIIYTCRHNELNKYQIFLHEADYHFNRSSEPYYELLLKMSFVFDELIILSNDNGTITSIHNLPFIKYRWGKIRTQLILAFEGDIFEEHMAFMDSIINDSALLIVYLNSPSMYGMYFNGCWGTHNQNASTKREINYIIDLDTYTPTEEIFLEEMKNSREVKLNFSSINLDNEPYRSSGNCHYIDNILKESSKELVISNNKKIIFQAKWIGLHLFVQ